MVDFPLFRKYNGVQTYFKIKSESSFQELKISEGFYSLNEFDAVNHFDRLFIQDMIQKHEDRWLETGEPEFALQLDYCQTHLKRIS
jgi:hypothetical protein